jgi:hypothetical protein
MLRADALDFSAPSMFGRDLIEQTREDTKGGDRQIPVIVEKCIEAVEILGKSSSIPFCNHELITSSSHRLRRHLPDGG